MKKTLLKNLRIYRITMIGVIAICCAIGLLCLSYYQKVQETVSDETSGYMQEIAKQMGTNIDKTINDNFAILGTISQVINESGLSTNQGIQEIIAKHKPRWNYRNIMLIDDVGVAYYDNNKEVALINDTYLQDTIVSKKTSISSSQEIDGKECIVFAMPMENMLVDGHNIVAIAGTYDLETFDKTLSMNAFGGSGYAHIIRDDGTVVIRSSSENAIKTGYNILHSLSVSIICNDQTINNVYEDIATGKSGQIEFKLSENHEYMTYTAINSQGWSLLTFVPVAVVNQKVNLLLNITLLICGLITVVFAVLFAVLVMTFFKNKQRLEHVAYVDVVTGGNTMNRVREIANELLSSDSEKEYAFIYANIEKFKVLNEQIGGDACDEVLRCINMGISVDLDEDECIGRIFADKFCLMVHYTSEKDLVDRFAQWQYTSVDYMKKIDKKFTPPIIEFGIYVITDKTIPLEHMIDRSKLALNEANKELHGRIRHAVYDESARKNLLREKYLEDMMETSLENHEFIVYLQPKYDAQSEKVGGAEALVRWKNETEGMIYPDEFIPIFEKNGFVVQLDLFVFEEVCKNIRRWIDAGQKLVKISVNCSRVHLKNPRFLDRYIEIAQQYKIPKDFIEIELTENAVFENVNRLTQVIDQIHEAGFGCSMDDFGSGYSSLNLIQDVPVDTIKIDKIFFNTNAHDPKRTESVIGSIIMMSKLLSMETVAEGVEERLQVDMLKRMGCNYIQGYFFAKPMPIKDFETVLFGKQIDD